MSMLVSTMMLADHACAWNAPQHHQCRARTLIRLQLSSQRSDQDETTSILEDIQRKLDQQQRQIEQLLNVVISQQQSTAASVHSTIEQSPRSSVSSSQHQQLQLTPIKAMLFIDGTWLYYSIFQRQSDNTCAISSRFGPLWPLTHRVDWQALTRIVSRCLMEQHQSSGVQFLSTPSSSSAPSQHQGRAVEIVRSSVFTSYKADTPTTSLRYKMFEELRQTNFDVHMMETVGKSEKCVDIQLAVEMLHFATVPHAYDVAVVLTGDKDFMPAMIRTRQKGRQVALVSMKRGCNQALVKTDMLKDFDVIWLDDHIEELIVPKSMEELPHGQRSLSVFTFMKVLRDYIEQSGEKTVSSREVGRYLKTVIIGSTVMLDELKNSCGGIYLFLNLQGKDVFSVSFDDDASGDSSVRSYRIGLKPKTDTILLEMAESADLSAAEKSFFESYTFATEEERPTYTSALGLQQRATVRHHLSKLQTPELHKDAAPDYSGYTLQQLRDLCRMMGLPVSGLKAAVIERLNATRKETVGQTKECEMRLATQRRLATGAEQSSTQHIPDTTTRHLISLLREYIQASGGKASSRDVGRYLAANRSSPETKRKHLVSALQELKAYYGSLANFVQAYPDILLRLDDVDRAGDDDKNFAFSIGLNKNVGVTM
ncbi:hypothetical protein MPSEU_001041700 [Mayamaea pseudoterrestris]|nr:hypothetical protein MPSEU_001041700 [Mayamaea pseudoterrestris]